MLAFSVYVCACVVWVFHVKYTTIEIALPNCCCELFELLLRTAVAQCNFRIAVAGADLPYTLQSNDYCSRSSLEDIVGRRAAPRACWRI